MKRNRKAKILATLGPASSSSDKIESLFKAGCDVFRLNFSHGSLETHRQNLESIRNLEEKYQHASCILADLQGPKLRVGEFKNTEESLKKGQKFILDTNSDLGDDQRVNFPHSEIYDYLTPNSTLLINDGRIRLQVVDQHKDKLITEVLNDGIISNNKGVNIPDIIIPIDSMTNKDRADLQKALEMNVDWVALSFVQQADDIIKLKKIVGAVSLCFLLIALALTAFSIGKTKRDHLLLQDVYQIGQIVPENSVVEVSKTLVENWPLQMYLIRYFNIALTSSTEEADFYLTEKSVSFKNDKKLINDNLNYYQLFKK